MNSSKWLFDENSEVKMDKLKLENEEKDRRISIAIISDAGSEFEKQKIIKYDGPLAAFWGMFADFTS